MNGKLLESIGCENLFEDILEPVEEGVGEVIADSIFMTLVIAIGLLSRSVSRNRENKAKLKKELEEKNIEKIKRDEYIEKHNIDDEDAYIEKIENAVKNDIKKMVAVLKKDTSLLSKIKNYEKSFQKGNSYKLPQTKITYVDEGDYILIIDGDQLVAMEFSYIISDMADALSVKYVNEIKFDFLTIETGDGDEGCIYINQ